MVLRTQSLGGVYEECMAYTRPVKGTHAQELSWLKVGNLGNVHVLPLHVGRAQTAYYGIKG
jgi:hypothetical protein